MFDIVPRLPVPRLQGLKVKNRIIYVREIDFALKAPKDLAGWNRIPGISCCREKTGYRNTLITLTSACKKVNLYH
jgi:hypothetical protein